MENDLFKSLLKKYNLSQTALSRNFNIPLRTVQSWCIGERKPPEYIIKMLDKLLDLGVKSL